MATDKSYIRNLLKALNFKLLNGSSELYEKRYNNNNNYLIQIDFDNEIINYETGEKEQRINVLSKTTSNFSQPENFVVLECVNRLLEKGYSANSIELEHSWSSGHGTSGRIDIIVKKNNASYLMIECKTWGKEYKKEKDNMLTTSKNSGPKGQLFSYCFQEKTTEYLCLYNSKLENDIIKYENAIIEVDDAWKTLPNQNALFDYWNKSFKYNGIFENTITPYNIECKALLRSDLQKITDADSSRIFNQFLEILRHNAVSDKPNAFNKILNLFICKIIDEDRNYDEEVMFQWKEDSTYITLQSNLEDLYKQGMIKFLDISVTDYSDTEIDKRLTMIDNNSKSEIKKMFQELRLQKNPEFAFKEVYNEESFNENVKVVKEVVQLLQPYQFRYGHKQQFLGNFFELLLNTSIKQESGQFFTPVPIAKFMISSLPIEKTITDKINSNSKQVLPVAIDYACGSGHFLTEYMDITQTVINSYDTSCLKKSVKNTFEKWKQSDDEESIQGEFEWAKDYVYGIEKDYRLVKTSKISTFLNGDGEANIIHADGLEKFTTNKYKGLLSSNKNINNNFDFVIANPPYSVSSFKQTLNCDSGDFETYDLLTDYSSEIECLFVERTVQLLKGNGCASIILPSSILTNSNQITERTKELLLKNFYLKAIAKMGPNTFMATGTSTVILFLQKRPETDYSVAENTIKNFSIFLKDFSFSGVQKVIEKYVELCFEDFKYEDYLSLLKKSANDNVINSEYYNELMSLFHKSKEFKDLTKKNMFKKCNIAEQEKLVNELFYSNVIEMEKRKLTFYLLTFSNQTLLIDTGEKQDEKNFLGYEFSNRRGSEGIHHYTDDDGLLVSSLYDEEDLFENKEKANYYINKTFKNEYPSIGDGLKNNLKFTQTSNLIKYNNLPFDLSMILETNSNITIDSKFDKKQLGKVCFIQKGTSVTQKQTVLGDIPVVAGGKEPAYYHNTSNRDANIITISASGANAGYANYWDKPIFASDCSTIKSIDEEILKTEYIYIILSEYQEGIYKLQKGQGQPHVYPEDLGKIKIPIPSMEIQNRIISEYENANLTIDNLKESIFNKKQEITEMTNEFFGNIHTIYKLSNLAKISRGASPRPIRKFLTKGDEGVNWIKIGDVKPNEKYISSTKQKITKLGAEKSVYVKKGDFVISNSMSIGRPYILDIDGCIHDGWLLITDIADIVLSDYLYYVLSNEYTQNQFFDSAVGSVVENLNITRVGKVSIPIPSKKVQQDFIKKVIKIESIIDEFHNKEILTKDNTFQKLKELLM